MKIYVVCYDGDPEHVFLDKQLAERYISIIDMDEEERSSRSIKEMEPSDDLMDDLKFITDYWFHYDISSKGHVEYYFNCRELNNLNHHTFPGRGQSLVYGEQLWPRSTKVKKQIIRFNSSTEIREHDLIKNSEEIQQRYRSLFENLMQEINRYRHEGWSIEKVNIWLTKYNLPINLGQA